MLSEISQRKTNTSDLTYLWNLQKQQTEKTPSSRILRRDWWLPVEGGSGVVGRGEKWIKGVNRHKLPVIK